MTASPMKLFSPPAISRPDDGVLSELASCANHEHEYGLGASQKSLEHYRRAGEALIKAKARVGHGRWLRNANRKTAKNALRSDRMRCRWKRGSQ